MLQKALLTEEAQLTGLANEHQLLLAAILAKVRQVAQMNEVQSLFVGLDFAVGILNHQNGGDFFGGHIAKSFL